MPSLYRKWRSRSFDDLIGQEHVTRTLRNAVRQQRVAHAYLFTGPRGTGKTSTARILAKAVNCLAPRDGNPCDECAMCRATNEGRAMDVIEIDAASNTSVENVRELRERVAYAAGEATFKVYIVDEVHRLSGAAFDAFLKTLEEPPPHVIFVFASTEPHKVPDTITSRCQRFDFRRIPPAEAFSRLQEVASGENIDITDDALRLIALHGAGSLRDALGLLGQVAAYTQDQVSDADVRAALGLADPLVVARLTDHLVAGRLGDGLAEFEACVDAGGEPRQVTRQFVDYWRALLLHVSGAPRRELSVDPALEDCLAQHGAKLQEAQVLAVLRALVDQEFSPKFNVPAELPFEAGYVQAALALRAPAPVTAAAPPPRAATPAVAPPAPRQAAQPVAGTPPPAEPAPAGESPSPVPSLAPGAFTDMGLVQVEQMWPAVLAKMREKNHRSLEALLKDSYVLKVGQGEITIGFLFPFHCSQFASVDKRKLLEGVVGEVLGSAYRVNVVRTTKEEIEARNVVRAVPESDGFIEEAAERLRRYHVRELGNGHS